MRRGFFVLLGAVVFLVYANCLFNRFVWDDEQVFVKNIFMTSPSYLGQLLTHNLVAGAGLISNLYRPLQSLTHFLDLHLWALNPAGHHLSNIIFHIGAALALFFLLCRLFPPQAAFWAAALFALHPLQSEAVAYVSGRADTLAILFLCLGLLSFEKRVWLAVFFAALSVLSKENMVLFPVFLFLFEYAAHRPIRLARHWPFWVLSGAYVIARLTILNFQNTLNFYQTPNELTLHFSSRVFTYFTTTAKGLMLWVWPLDLHHERSWPVFTLFSIPQVWVSCLVLTAFLSIAFLMRKKSRAVTVGIAWFFIATFPTSNLVFLINYIFCDHWFLAPGLGLALIAGAAIVYFESRAGRVTTLVCAALCVALALMTFRQNTFWRTPISLNSRIISFEPFSAKINSNLGMAYSDEGKTKEAIRYYKRAIEISDEYPQTHHNLGNTYLEAGREDEAIEEFQKAVAITPSFYQSWMQLGVLYFRQGKLEEAQQAFEKALKAFPYNPQAYLGLAAVQDRRGNLSEADSLRKMAQKVRIAP